MPVDINPCAPLRIGIINTPQHLGKFVIRISPLVNGRIWSLRIQYRRYAVIIRIVPITDPFKAVIRHGVQPEWVGWETINRE
ncbi:hypothetical protein D3C80_1633750 [compost metagenome]